jgi:Glycine rich protein
MRVGLLGAWVAACCPGLAAASTTVTFQSTGAEQTFVVPAGVGTVHVLAVGGRGYSVSGAYGAGAVADLPVSPGEVLYVEVGGNGRCVCGMTPGVVAASAGFNGGGIPSGAGASDVRTIPASAPASLTSRLIVAGGGGGGGSGPVNTAGGSVGMPGHGDSGGGGGPGTLTAAGAGGAGGGAGGVSGGGSPGALGQGGDGGSPSPGGGGGGGGLYGGGGGGSGAISPQGEVYGSGGGGGGGSSGFASSARNTSVFPDLSGVPLVAITYVSNAFQISRPTVSASGVITLPLHIAGAGRITAMATASAPAPKGRRHGAHRVMAFGTASVSVSASQDVRLTIKPTRPAAALLASGASLPVRITATFSPTGGTPNSQRVQVTARGKKRHPPHHTSRLPLRSRSGCTID